MTTTIHTVIACDSAGVVLDNAQEWMDAFKEWPLFF